MGVQKPEKRKDAKKILSVSSVCAGQDHTDSQAGKEGTGMRGKGKSEVRANRRDKKNKEPLLTECARLYV